MSKGSLYGIRPDQIPPKCWGWSNLVRILLPTVACILTCRRRLQEIGDSRIQVSVQNLAEEIVDIVEDEEEIELQCEDEIPEELIEKRRSSRKPLAGSAVNSSETSQEVVTRGGAQDPR